MTPHTDATPRPRIFTSILTVIGLVLALLVPLVAGAQGAGATTTMMTPTEKLWANAVLSMMNTERKLHGLPALTMRSPLQTSGRRHDVRMAAYNTMSHQLPGEAPFYDRIEAAGYYWTSAGENIAWNSSITFAGVTVLQSLMYNEVAPNNGHRLNILSRSFANVGIDIYMDFVHHKVWMTEDFGHL